MLIILIGTRYRTPLDNLVFYLFLFISAWAVTSLAIGTLCGEHAKKLQQLIIKLTFVERERQLDKAKEALERAFTPKIKKLLEKELDSSIWHTNQPTHLTIIY